MNEPTFLLPFDDQYPDRRMADGDRRERPGAGYGKAASLDPHNRRIVVRRSWRKAAKTYGRPQPPGKAFDDMIAGRL